MFLTRTVEKAISALYPLTQSLASTATTTVHVPSFAREKILQAFLKVVATPYSYERNFVPLSDKATQVLKRELPPEVVDSIKAVASSERGFVEITGTPTDPDLMPTPKDFNGGEEKTTYVSELFSMGIAGLLGQKVYNFKTEGRGTGPLILNIVPVKSQLDIKGAGGVRAGFGFHMENAWHLQTPDSLILKGLRQDHDAVATTYAIANRVIYNLLSQRERTVLSTHTYKIAPPEVHFRAEREKGIVFSADKPYLGPVIRAEKSGSAFMINFNGMRSNTDDPEAEAALKKVEMIAQEHSYQAKLRPDNALVINNRRAIHTRNGYEPRFDGQDRWFQRYYLIDADKLWPNAILTAGDFAMLSERMAITLLKYWVTEGIITKHGRLTPKCNPHIEKLPLPSDLEEHRLAITKQVLRKGPAFPHRVV